jgi:hypothetical protein
MITAWQLSALDEVPERLVRFGRVRMAVSIAVIEDGDGLRVEARCGRKLVERIRLGYDRDRIPEALEQAWRSAVSGIVALQDRQYSYGGSGRRNP